jgi:hypothetical protein
MPTILELFTGSSNNITPNTPPQIILEKVFRNSLQTLQILGVKAGTSIERTFNDVRQQRNVKAELNGIRINSKVDLNNPLIYGNEAIRIATRSTSLVEIMKTATNGDAAGGGLIGGTLSAFSGGKVTSISQAKDAVNSFLGIPITQIPSRLIGKISEQRSSDAITRDLVGANGTGFGKFLKNLGGGDPKTLGKQALGAGIGLVKSKLRDGLFGKPQTIGEVVGEPIQTFYSDTNTYTRVLTDERNYKSLGATTALDDTRFDNFGIDLRKVSPLYGVVRDDGKFGRSEYAFTYIRDNTFNAPLTRYTPQIDKNYSKWISRNRHSLEDQRGLENGRDIVNLITAGDKIDIDDNGKFKYNGSEYKDLVTFHIGKLGADRTMFRSNITGLSETTSPSWNSHKFLGNPFPFYTYSQVERSVSFNLQVYCSSPTELATNWEKLSALTGMTYPASSANNLIQPPIIQFKLGDLYHEKYGFIDSLSYTIPDTGTWETEINGLQLPKFIDVAITIKLIENVGSAYSLYGFTKSKEAVKSINDARSANQMSTGPQTGITATFPSPIDSRGIVLNQVNIPKVNVQKPGSLGSVKGKIRSLLPKENKVNIQTPEEKMNQKFPSNVAQPAVIDGLKSSTAATFMAEQTELTGPQAGALASMKMWYTNVKQIPKSAVPPEYGSTEIPDTNALWYSATGVFGEDIYAFINNENGGLKNGYFGVLYRLQ